MSIEVEVSSWDSDSKGQGLGTAPITHLLTLLGSLDAASSPLLAKLLSLQFLVETVTRTWSLLRHILGIRDPSLNGITKGPL